MPLETNLRTLLDAKKFRSRSTTMVVAAIVFVLSISLLGYFLYIQDKLKEEIEVNRQTVKLGLGQSLYVIIFFWIRGVKTPPFEFLYDLKKIYGRVFIFSLVVKNRVYGVISDLQIAHSISNKSEWMNRAPEDHYFFDYSWGKPYGLLFGNGEYSKIGRKLTQKIFHLLGISRLSKLEQTITMEYLEAEQDILRVCTRTEDSTMEVGHQFQRYTLNVICQLLFSKRFERGNKEGEALIQAVSAVNSCLKLGSSLAELWPSLNKLPFIRTKSLQEASDLICDHSQKQIEKRRRSGSYRENPEDYIDYFMIEIDRHRNDEDAEYYSDKNLMCSLRDLVFAGMDTSSATTNYAILHLAQNLDIQRRVQSEIDEVLGSRTPVYADKAKMKYTEAFLWENLRYGTPVPVTVRSSTEDVTFDGEKMPKGSALMINIHAIHRSNDIWGDPDVFRPERFLNENQDTLINVEKIMPFGHGRRYCIGESIGKLTVFIFVVSLLQRFTFELSNLHPPPATKGQFGIAKSPMPFYVKVRERNADC